VSQRKDETLGTRIESAKPINVSHDFRRSLSSPFYHLIEIGSGRINKFGQRALCPLLRIDRADRAPWCADLRRGAAGGSIPHRIEPLVGESVARVDPEDGADRWIAKDRGVVPDRPLTPQHRGTGSQEMVRVKFQASSMDLPQEPDVRGYLTRAYTRHASQSALRYADIAAVTGVVDPDVDFWASGGG